MIQNHLSIQHNHHYIQQQIAAFNHNSGILTNQCNQYNLNNAEILKQQEIKNAITLDFGNSIINKQNEINRNQLAHIVFNPDYPDALTTLEKITHPVISERIHSILEQHRPTAPAVLLDAPVMFKAGWDQMCDKVVFVNAKLVTRK